jgi:hypothetical protein
MTAASISTQAYSASAGRGSTSQALGGFARAGRSLAEGGEDRQRAERQHSPPRLP